MAERKHKKTDGGPNRKGTPISLWLPVSLRKALDVQLERSRRPLTTEVIIALEKHLTEEGLWPPADGGGEE